MNFHLTTECRDENLCTRMKATLPEGQSEVGAIHLNDETKIDTSAL